MPDPILFRLSKLTVATILVAALSACSSSGLGGLGGGGLEDSKNRSSVDSVKLQTRLDTQIEADLSVAPSQRGLELRVLTVDDAGNQVAQALSPYIDDSGMVNSRAMQTKDRERWASWGLRWVVVPADELDAVLGSLTFTRAAQVHWMGEFPQWRPLIRTGQIHNGTVRVGDGLSSVRLEELNGRPRILARVWTTPEMIGSDARARLHIDMAVQMTQEQHKNRWDTPAILTALDAGVLIDELKMSQVLDSTSALILVGEDPAIQWLSEARSGTVSVSQVSDGSLGPSAPLPRTLGQQMLSSIGTGYVAPDKEYVSPKKVLIVLVPKVGGPYRLLGLSSSQQQRISP